jgi:hypothetical protein
MFLMHNKLIDNEWLVLDFWFKHGLNIKLKIPKMPIKKKRVTFVTLLFSVVPPGIELSQQLIANQCLELPMNGHIFVCIVLHQHVQRTS